MMSTELGIPKIGTPTKPSESVIFDSDWFGVRQNEGQTFAMNMTPKVTMKAGILKR